MKLVILVLALQFLCLETHAQEYYINSPNLPAYGYKIYDIDTLGISEGLPGGGKLWDFSNLRIIDSSGVNFLEQIGDMPYKDYFPNANYCIVNDDKNNILFLRRTNEFIAYCGSISMRKYFFIERIDDDKVDTLLNYPLYYGMPKHERYIEFTQFQIKDSSEGKCKQLLTTEVDGSGTIKTPDGQEYKVLRIKVISDQESDLYRYIHGQRLYIHHERDIKTRYKWITNEMPFPFVFYINFDYTEITNQDSSKRISSETSVEYDKPISLNCRPDFNNANLHIIKNDPNILLVAFTNTQSENGTIQVLDMLGKIVYQSPANTPEGTLGDTVQQLDISSLAPGEYFVTYTSEKKKGVKKWVKW